MNNQLSWPENAEPGTQSPPVIERYLKSEITRRQVTLIGELDLIEPTSYANISWSLLDLANYLVSKPIIKSTLTNTSTWSNGIWPYPSTLAIWSVGHAQTAKDGTKLWELEGYSTSQKAKLAELFSWSIKALGLESFEGELENAQKYVQLARIHAMIPDFAIERYCEIINRGVNFNRPKVQILNEIVADSAISKSVQRLFSGNPTIGLDLIERSFNFVAYGHQIDLPDRIKSKLSNKAVRKRKAERSSSFPKVFFVEWERNIEIRSAPSWKLEDQSRGIVDSQHVPCRSIFTSDGTSERIEILNPNLGFLIFDEDGNLTDNRYLPNGGGFFLWNSKVQLLSEIPHLDPGYISGDEWSDWQYTYFQSLDRLHILVEGLGERSLVQRKSLALEIREIPHLMNVERQPVFASYPLVSEAQFLKITDNVLGEQWTIDNLVGPIKEDSGGEIDLTFSAGLGKSKNFRGLVIPGIEVIGLANALRKEEKRQIIIKFPNDWKVKFPVDQIDKSEVTLSVEGKTDQQIPMMRVSDPKGVEHLIGIDVPILSWSIEYKNRENVMIASELNHTLEDRKFIQALILHEVDDYVPLLKVGDVFVSGRKRGRDVRYDLRFLQEERRDENTVVSISWNYENIELISFRRIPIKQSIVIKDLRELGNAAVKANIITLEEWQGYQASKARESRILKDRARHRRGW
jgi:hypothetical protein